MKMYDRSEIISYLQTTFTKKFSYQPTTHSAEWVLGLAFARFLCYSGDTSDWSRWNLTQQNTHQLGMMEKNGRAMSTSTEQDEW